MYGSKTFINFKQWIAFFFLDKKLHNLHLSLPWSSVSRITLSKNVASIILKIICQGLLTDISYRCLTHTSAVDYCDINDWPYPLQLCSVWVWWCEGVELFLLSDIQHPNHQMKHILSVYVRSVKSVKSTQTSASSIPFNTQTQSCPYATTHLCMCACVHKWSPWLAVTISSRYKDLAIYAFRWYRHGCENPMV